MTLFDKMDRTILRNIKIEHIFKRESDTQKDSIEIGQVSKGGVIKVYGDFNDPEAFKHKINDAVALKAYANSKMYGSNDVTKD